MAQRRLLVATYNIHRAVGRDGVGNIERIASVLHEIAADVVGIQEIDCAAHDDPRADHLAHLASACGMYPVAGPLIRRQQVGVGIAILSRHPVTARRWIDLAVVQREPRGALDVDVETPFGPLRVVTTHLGLKSSEREIQLGRLVTAVRPKGWTVVLGDFNEWKWRAPGITRMHATFGETPGLRSFPARAPIVALDRIFAHPRSTIVDIQVIATATARMASDHLPVRAILELDAPPSGVLP